MKILALDVATKTGWCLGEHASGVWDFKKQRDESGGMKLVRFRSKLEELYLTTRFDLVVFERVGGRFKSAISVQAELHGVLKHYCEINYIDYRAFSSAEVKRHATGKGNANKKSMVDAAVERWPNINIIDDNHADALWIWNLAVERYGRGTNDK